MSALAMVTSFWPAIPWLSAGLEPHAVGVTARSAALVREALEAAGIATASLSGRSHVPAVRTGTMHAIKGLEFQAVAVIGVEQGLVPEPGAVTPETEDPLAYAQDLRRERCVLFVACTRARDHLHVSGTGEPSPFLPPGAVESAPPHHLLDAENRARARTERPDNAGLRSGEINGALRPGTVECPFI
jgi:UvrD-like helicase C-terminal domain